MRRSSAPSRRMGLKKSLHKPMKPVGSGNVKSTSGTLKSSTSSTKTSSNLLKRKESPSGISDSDQENQTPSPPTSSSSVSSAQGSSLSSLNKTGKISTPLAKKRRLMTKPKSKSSGFAAPKIDGKALKKRMEEESKTAEECKLFAVMWCKSSNKKHKTYNDGFLFLQGANNCLKDPEGKDLYNKGNRVGKMPRTRTGDLIYLGGKEVEIMNELDPQLYFSGKLFVGKGGFGVDAQGKKGLQIQKSKQKTFKKHGKVNGKTVEAAPKTKPKPLHDPESENALVLNEGHPAKNSKGDFVTEVVVDPFLGSRLRPHQRDGVRFLYECVMNLRSPDYAGCILADEMGLGKTIQAITLLWTLLKQGPLGVPVVKKALVVTPSSLVGNWDKELRKWLGTERLKATVIKGGSTCSSTEAAKQVKQFVKSVQSNVLLISYEMFRACSSTIGKMPSVGLVICDEGHRLKNSQSQIAQALNNLATRRRVILSGTPIQNQMNEFHAMINFINPDMLGTKNTFMRVFGTPIMRGRNADAETKDKHISEERSKELTRMTMSCILRRTAKVNEKYLPDKIEVVVMCKPTDLQVEAYKSLLRSGQQSVYAAVKSGSMASALGLIINLRKACNSPMLCYKSVLENGTRDYDQKIYSENGDGADYSALWEYFETIAASSKSAKKNMRESAEGEEFAAT
eukprot:TRINITY_DN4476_c0_g1_i3.p1 TRINITY_DN4476_c0_g1~~TRINITY_DN4476_c0_g1_i3.p1  ORF type:complete len:681 (+),score=218.17 TRINITY_DN4476_c0_g1_i3:493-2535(+)